MAAALPLPCRTNRISVGLGAVSPTTQVLPSQVLQKRHTPHDPRGYVSPGQEHSDLHKRRSSLPVRPGSTLPLPKPYSTLPHTMAAQVTDTATQRPPHLNHYGPLPPTPPPKDDPPHASSSTKSTIRLVPSTEIFDPSAIGADGDPKRNASLSSIRPVSGWSPAASLYSYAYPPAKSLPPTHLPPTWGVAHDRFICVADAKGESLGEIADALRLNFPDVGVPISMGLVDKRLRMLDQAGAGYWKEGLGMVEVGRGYESGQSSVAVDVGERNSGGGGEGKERGGENGGGEGKRKSSSGLPVPVGSKVVRKSVPSRKV